MSNKWYSVILFTVLLFSVSSCGLLRKFSKTTTITETITKVDTLVQIKVDTIVSIKKVYLTDTAKLENTYSRAMTYYDTTIKKIVLKLQAKDFQVPISFNQVVKQKQKTVEKEADSIVFFIILILILILLFYMFIKK